jgi:anti-sigma factor RsiW
MGQAAGELSCQELVELVTDYFEDALAPEERARFEEHLEGCPGCRAYVDQMRVTMRLVQATEQLEQRPEVAGLMRAFSDWKRDRS